MSYSEKAVVFGSASPLVGVITRAEVPAEAGPGVLLLNAGLLHHIGAERMNVQLARRLAERGAHALRFDCSGIGDSPPRADHLPFAEASVAETIEAMDLLGGETGCDGFVLAGLCSGADQAFQVALRDDRVRGVVLLDPYPYETPGYRLHRWARPLSRPDTWVKAARGGYGIVGRVRDRIGAAANGGAPERVDPGLAVRDIPPREVAEQGYLDLIARGVSVFVVFTAGQLGTYNHEQQFWNMHPRLPKEHPGLRYEYFGMADHTVSLRNVRELLLGSVARWYGDRFAAAA